MLAARRLLIAVYSSVCACVATGRQRYRRGINLRARLPPLGFYGGDSGAAVDAYISLLLRSYAALERQLSLLDPAFMMARVCCMLRCCRLRKSDRRSERAFG